MFKFSFSRTNSPLSIRLSLGQSAGALKRTSFQSIFAGLLLLACAAVAQPEIQPAETLRSLDQWLKDNVADETFDFLGLDRDRTHQFLTQLEPRLQGSQVFDLAAFKETAHQLLPFLQQFEETQPFAAWLEAHTDYFDVAENLRKEAGPKAPRDFVTSPEKQRRAWVTVIERRPAPPQADKRVRRLKEIFTQERVPAELIWLAEVESSFNPRARSPVGAAGLFQLMPGTARDLNLTVGFLRDDRMNEDKNARAAAQYLRRLHERFGDWRLALAAYNAGEKRVADLLARQKGKSFDAIAARLPAETQMYVPKVEATIRRRENRALQQMRVGTG